jgi:hypothetical protein
MRKDKKNNDMVFSFTLIDLLIQVIFLGLIVVAVVHQGKDGEAAFLNKKLAASEAYKGKYNELTDRLTTLSPNYVDLIKELEDKKLKGGLDQPSCLRAKNGKVERLANLRLRDNKIEIIENNPRLQLVLKDIGFNFSQVRSMSPHQFRKTFSGIRKYKKNCVYYMGLCEKTKDLELRDTVEQYFYKMSCDQRSRKLASED